MREEWDDWGLGGASACLSAVSTTSTCQLGKFAGHGPRGAKPPQKNWWTP